MASLKTIAIKDKLVKTELVTLFAKLGISVPPNRRKSELLEYLGNELNKHEPLTKCQQLISLDLGLKNMSLARFSKPKQGRARPTLEQWFKKNLEPNDSFQFNPVNYSKLTYGFMEQYILPDSMTETASDVRVIFERQRFRTGGSSNVLESTLKTNTIEAMLCMGLTMHNENCKQSRIEFSPSPPGAMVKYWQQQYQSILSPVLSAKESKAFRIDLVLTMIYNALASKKLQPRHLSDACGSYLSVIPIFELSDTITENLERALKRRQWEEDWTTAWSFKAKSRRLWEVARLINEINSPPLKVSLDQWGVNKGDDLADSVLHGLAYFQYLENRDILKRTISSKGSIRAIFQLNAKG